MFPFAQLHCLGLSKGRTVAPASPSKRRRRVSRSRYMSHLRRCGVLEAVVEHFQVAAQPVQLGVQRLDLVHQFDHAAVLRRGLLREGSGGNCDGHRRCQGERGTEAGGSGHPADGQQ